MRENLVCLADLHTAGPEILLWLGIIASIVIVHMFCDVALGNWRSRKETGPE
jgi:hypothetical protein